MSYATINTIANDATLQARVTACAADEGSSNPAGAAQSLVWPIATADDIVAAYASALADGNPNPGGDESVITDGMILGVVQAHLPPEPES